MVRRVMPRRSRDDLFPWLRHEESHELTRRYLAERRREPRRLGHRIAWHISRRDLVTTRASLALIAADHDVTMVNPFLDNRFLAALTARAGRRLCPTRNELLSEIVGGCAPAVVTAPRPKARFLEVFLRSPTMRFVHGWNGGGVDQDLVDCTALRDLWSRWPIPPGTAPLVQYLWWVTGESDSSDPRVAGSANTAAIGP
jgi:asparagine synthase (glutamine-hydrolysing)